MYKIALSLAKRYSVPLWEVYMTHLEFLFTDSGYVHKHTVCVVNTVIIYPSAAILPLYTVVATTIEHSFLQWERADQPSEAFLHVKGSVSCAWLLPLLAQLFLK